LTTTSDTCRFCTLATPAFNDTLVALDAAAARKLGSVHAFD
jgi:hypothetical protein